MLEKAANLKAPLFILSAPRSFTSLICAMLGQHPQTYGVPELNLLSAETIEQLLEGFKGLKQFQLHGLLRVVAQLYHQEQSIQTVEMAYRWIMQRYSKTTAEIYRELCAQIYPLIIVDKSPCYSTQLSTLQRIERTFPDAHYLYIVRHPRAQGRSMMNVADGLMTILGHSIDYSVNPPCSDPQVLWADIQRTALNFLETIPAHRQRRLRGEEVLGDPEKSFQGICEWLNLRWDEAAYQAMLRPDHSVYACPGPYGAQLGNDPNFLKSPIFKSRPIALEALAGPLSWREDGKGFIPDVIEIARSLGY